MLEELLTHHPVFTCLDPDSHKAVVRSAIPKRYQKGECIACHAESWPYLFLVEMGTVQAIKESAGRSLLVVEMDQGEIFWGVSFFIDNAPLPVALMAKAETSLYLWSLDDLKPIILNNGRMSWELTRLMINKMQYASEILNEFAFQPITGRLARLLLDHFEDAVEDYVARDMTLDEMAARIGSTREMVCRHLYHFADQGAILINRTELKITDQTILKELVGKDTQ
ncbi:MAG: Crp/Fnr family transcriptional regulator [Anaerolineales bacterium]